MESLQGIFAPEETSSQKVPALAQTPPVSSETTSPVSALDMSYQPERVAPLQNPLAERYPEPQFSLVLDCTDNLTTRNAINAACVNAKVPLVSGAAIRFEGQVASFSMQNDGACYHCLSQLFGEQQLTCMEAGILSPIVGIIGGMQALEAVKILAGIGMPLYGKLQLFDALTGKWQQFALKKDPDCSVCAAG